MSSDKKIIGPIFGCSIGLLFIIGILYRLYEEYIYKYAFYINYTIKMSDLAGHMRVGRFGIFIVIWILLLIANHFICTDVLEKIDFFTQMKLTSILYLGIGATTFVLIGLIPSLVEIFENTFGLFIVSTRPTAWMFEYQEIMKVFQSKFFKNAKDIAIPFDSILPLFNIHTFQNTFDAIHDDKDNILSNDDDDDNEHYDFYFDYSKMCVSEDAKEQDDAKQHFRDALFKLCFAKYNTGHFAWVYITTIVTMLSVASIN